jgi:cholesterol transport system auxiliary component
MKLVGAKGGRGSFGWAQVFALGAVLLAAGCNTAAVFDIYDLGAPSDFSGLKGASRAQILVLEPSALKSLDAPEIVVKTSPTQITYLARSQWPDRLPKVVQARLVQAFENSKRVRAVAKPGEGLVIDYQIVTDIRAFEARIGSGEQSALVSLSVKLVSDRSGKVLRSKVFETQAPISSGDAPAVVNGINAAFDAIARDLVQWALAGA